MRTAFNILFLFFAFVPIDAASAQADHAAPADRLAAIAWLAGDWSGTGEGQPGTSTSSRHSERVHSNHFIRVEARSVYAPQERNRTGETHTSTDIWSFDRRRNLLVMRQFDSLGFVSTYVQDVAASTAVRLVLVSEHLENVPVGWRGRYTYEHSAADEYQELFELDNGSGFQPYVASRFRRGAQIPRPRYRARPGER